MPWSPDNRPLTERLGLRKPPRKLPCHVWVDEDPGVLLEWQQVEGVWWGRVVVVSGGRAELAMVRADRLRPAQ